jgi:4-hydroxy-tetrahydrodipicolinate reductase
MKEVIRVAVAGASGKMGQAVIAELLNASQQFALHAAFDQPSSPLLGRDAAERLGLRSGVTVTPGPDSLQGADVLIDFTRPEATMAHLQVCQQHGVRPVIGTTGFSQEQLLGIKALSQKQAVVLAPNMSVGVNIFFRLAEIAAGLLHQGYDIEVIEAHHRAKVDAPSGTALKVGERVAKAAGRQWPQDAVWQRHGHTGARSDQEIGFSVVRGGDIIGDHTVMFAGSGERIELTHRSSSRTTYATGALRAAAFVVNQPWGLFDMPEVLGLSELKAQ